MPFGKAWNNGEAIAMPRKPIVWDNVQPWERQRNERSEAFQAFQAYRDMGADRNQRAVAQQLSKSPTLVANWSRRWGWVERVAAWENELDRHGREVQIQEVEEMYRRHVQEAVSLQRKGIEALRITDADILKFSDIVAALREGSNMERLARNLPTAREHVEIEGNPEKPITIKVIYDDHD